MDCMEAMREMPDKAFELAIVDPPYGGGGSQTHGAETKQADLTAVHYSRNIFTEVIFSKPEIDVERTGGTWAAKYGQRLVAGYCT
jgi:DNA modification methylase